jgi:hypothetical protein
MVILLLAVLGSVLISTGAVAQPLAADEMLPTPAITVRIHDYAGISTDAIEYAQRRAADVYAGSGIAVRWAAGGLRPAEPPVEPEPAPTADLSVIVLNRRMADRFTSSRDVMGFAVLGEGETGGRVAYVLYDRVEEAAQSCGCPAKKVLVLFIAN